MKIGDKVVCVNIPEGLFGSTDLTINKLYEIKSLDIGDFRKREHNRIRVKNDSDFNCWYYSDRFETISHIRKLKLKKLNESNL